MGAPAMDSDDSKSRERSSISGAEKSPIEPSDYAGLQLDTEAQDRNQQLHGEDRRHSTAKTAAFTQSDRAHLANEKGLEAGGPGEDPPPPAPSYEAASAPIPKVDDAMKEAVPKRHGAVSTQGRVCGMRRVKFFILLAAVLVIVIVAAVVGGVVGSRNNASSLSSAASSTTSAPPVVTPTSNPAAVNSGLPQSDLMVDTPLVPVAFNQNASGSSEPSQTYWLFFQTVNSNIKQAIRGTSAANADWQNAVPIFTDAHPNSGLAAITYLNESQPQTSLFYTGADSTLWEKRLYIGTGVWETGSLLKSHWPVPGNSSFSGDGGWNGFRMAAVYSTNFATGPGARLFYHNGNASATWVQEIIWYNQNDTWVIGSQIAGADPTSHLTATIEPSSQILRLFYSTGNGDVQEQWLNITAPNGAYQLGVKIPALLARTTSDMSTISTNKSTFLYYASAPSATANITIRELELSPQPSSVASASSNLVAIPDLLADDTNHTLPSTFAPLAAVLSTLDGGQTITVMWADGVTDPKSGYGALRAVSRAMNASWGDVVYGQAQGMTQVPIGDDNANPA